MSNETNNQSKPGFSSSVLPGSVAEQKETERLAEFSRQKAVQKADAERSEPALAAEREKEYQRNMEANQKMMNKQRASRAQRAPFQIN